MPAHKHLMLGQRGRTSTLAGKSWQVFVEEGAAAAVRKVLGYLTLQVQLAAAAGALKIQTRRGFGTDEAVAFAFAFRLGNVTIKPAQVPEEIRSLLDKLQADPPQRVLEIGTARGGTLFLLARVAADTATLATVDLKGGYGAARIPLLKALKRPAQTLHIYRADSHDTLTRDRISSHFKDPLDLLLIDGDHSEEGVRRDFELYSPLVRSGGLIAFHDIVDGPPEMVGDVPSFWREVSRDRESIEIVSDEQQGGYGIGLLRA